MSSAVRYVPMDDGVRLAYWSYGDGPTLVTLPNIPFDTFHLGSLIPQFRSWGAAVDGERRVLTYDSRGLGLSDRSLDIDLSLERHVRDLLAIVDREGLERVDLFAAYRSSAIAVAFAAQYPERVSRLILWCGTPRPLEFTAFTQVRLSFELLRNDWPAYADMMSFYLVGWTDAALGKSVVDYIKENFSQAQMMRLMEAYDTFDVTAYLPQVRAKTLVMHRMGIPWPEVRTARELAAAIEQARLVVVEGRGSMPWLSETAEPTSAIDAFLRETEVDIDQPATRPAHPRSAQGGNGGSPVRTIVFSDVANHTAMMERLGDAKAREILRRHERITRDALARYGGTEVKALGDGFMMSFNSAQSALQCAIALQKNFEKSAARLASEQVRLHIGVNAGEPIEEDSDLFGSSVILASRAAAKAEAGQILVTNVVRELVSGKGFRFDRGGEFEVKGFAEPVRLYELYWV